MPLLIFQLRSEEFRTDLKRAPVIEPLNPQHDVFRTMLSLAEGHAANDEPSLGAHRRRDHQPSKVRYGTFDQPLMRDNLRKLLSKLYRS